MELIIEPNKWYPVSKIQETKSKVLLKLVGGEIIQQPFIKIVTEGCPDLNRMIEEFMILSDI